MRYRTRGPRSACPAPRSPVSMAGHRLLRSILLAVLVLVLTPAAAGAHGGAGEITVESVEVDGLTVRIVASITSVIDGHPAQPATFVVDATAVDESTGVSEVPLDATGTEGTYQAAFDLPAAGEYLLTLTSTLPPATLEQRVSAETPGTSPVDPTATGPAGPTSAPTTAPSVTATVLDDDADSEQGPPAYLVAGLAVSLAAAVLVAVLVLRSRRSSRATGRRG